MHADWKKINCFNLQMTVIYVDNIKKSIKKTKNQ